MAALKEYNVEKRDRGNQYHLPYDIMSVRKNIK